MSELNRIVYSIETASLNHKFLAFSFQSTFLQIFIDKYDIQDIRMMNACHEYLHTQNFISTGHEKLLYPSRLMLDQLASRYSH